MNIFLDKIRKIHFVDQTSEKNHHMVFNASMIAVLSCLVPNAPITHYGISSNLKATSELIPKSIRNNCNQVSIFNPKINSRFLIFKALNYLRKESIRIKMFFKLFQNTTNKDLVVLSITTFTSFLVFKILKCFYKTPVLCILHGDVDYLYKTTTWIEKINGFFNKIIFKLKAPNFYYIMLNKIAKQIIVRDGYLKEWELFEINHPFICLPEVSANKIEFSKKKYVTIGHIGSMEVERKNSHYYYIVASILKEYIITNKIIFETIGLITPGLLPYKNQWVKEIIGNSKPEKPDYLNRSEYESSVSRLDFALFFFDESQYLFRASGAVIDAIAFEIPIIVLKHPFFDNLFKQEGPIGYCCNSMEEVVNVIEKISKKNEEIVFEYEFFIKNLKNLKYKFSVENCTNDLKNQLERISN